MILPGAMISQRQGILLLKKQPVIISIQPMPIEVLDEENHEKFRLLKENLIPEVEIVQMYYGNQLANGTVYNFDRELRPKLFKRLRNFVWTEPVHEDGRTPSGGL